MEMEFNFYILLFICGFCIYCVECDDGPCYGCQLFNVKEKEQKSRRAVCIKILN